MRAALCPEFGPPEVVRLADVPAPVPTTGQVRVRVHAAAANFSDVLLVAGEYQVRAEPPFVPGSEFAGVVEEIVGDVPGIRVGDRVAGTGLVGAFAEQAVVGAHAVTPVPDTVEFTSAAAFGVAHRTAYHALHTVAELRGGQELVVLGAGGGVGLAAVQLGALAGARVTAVASSAAKLEAAKANGASVLIDHRSCGDLRTALKQALPAGADVVLDPVGGGLAEPALRSVRWGGQYVTIGFTAGIPRLPLNLVLLKGAQVTGFQLRDVAAHLPERFQASEARLKESFAEGTVRPHIGAVYPLAEAAAALRAVADGRAVGKVVVDVAGSN
ncbi:NADPH:quinone oxidoreductase family protein [Streptomyces sp. PSKA54]|uniref:NADPH:quinone oxidoreductase family protein n=1 Tax=Streptomyces himalayensis subsp. aureolus TaxID=2758039 RepID=A0A7W2D2S2_9ACTN|nr:NADPH:quinone oxidoreductase family protein [Streptomyces himalayensis]MBA4863542.1 NADPH:quinone oxidoreductase family protein [Streptomyces himalayensis subsp. aureolus]